MRAIALVAACVIGLSSAHAAQPDAAPSSADSAAAPSVGIEGRITAIIAGAPLSAVPVSDRAPLIVRIAAAEPATESATRYDLRFLGAVPGTYDLRDYLIGADGAHPALPALPVRVRSLITGESHDLVDAPAAAEPPLGGYRRWLAVAGIAWVAALPLLVLARRRAAPVAPTRALVEPTLAEQLSELAARAHSGAMPPREQARLERLLIGHWRGRLALDALPPAEALAALRCDREAGALLRQVERWLHARPGSAEPVDVDALLAPYRASPAIAEAPVVAAEP